MTDATRHRSAVTRRDFMRLGAAALLTACAPFYYTSRLWAKPAEPLPPGALAPEAWGPAGWYEAIIAYIDTDEIPATPGFPQQFKAFRGQVILLREPWQRTTYVYLAGYSGTELGDWGYMPTEPAVLRAELARRGVTMTGAFVPVAFRHAEAHADGVARALRVARLLAAVADPASPPFLVLADDNGTDPARTQHAGRVTPDLGLSADEWPVFAQGVEAVDHSHYPEDLIAKGRDIEGLTLARAVGYHIERRVFLNSNRTVVL